MGEHACDDCGVKPCVCFDYDERDQDCWNCGGEGFVYGCSWDWQCDTYDPGEGTCLCSRRCDVCNPKPATAIPARGSTQEEGAE